MTPRRGVTLIEVLVAAVLLAVGISGTLHAMAASFRLRVDADAREQLVGLMLDRLAWLEARACTQADTAAVTRVPGGPEAAWSLRAVGSTRILEIRGARRAGGGGARSHILTSLQCD